MAIRDKPDQKFVARIKKKQTKKKKKKIHIELLTLFTFFIQRANRLAEQATVSYDELNDVGEASWDRSFLLGEKRKRKKTRWFFILS